MLKKKWLRILIKKWGSRVEEYTDFYGRRVAKYIFKAKMNSFQNGAVSNTASDVWLAFKRDILKAFSTQCRPYFQDYSENYLFVNSHIINISTNSAQRWVIRVFIANDLELYYRDFSISASISVTAEIAYSSNHIMSDDYTAYMYNIQFNPLNKSLVCIGKYNNHLSVYQLDVTYAFDNSTKIVNTTNTISNMTISDDMHKYDIVKSHESEILRLFNMEIFNNTSHASHICYLEMAGSAPIGYPVIKEEILGTFYAISVKERESRRVKRIKVMDTEKLVVEEISPEYQFSFKSTSVR